MNDREKKIKEQRTLEATKKNLMGVSGKLGIIVQIIGEPLIWNSNGLFTSSSLFEENNWDDDELPTMEQLDVFGYPISEPETSEWMPKRKNRINLDVYQIGWHYDGLRNGNHMEIKYTEDEAELMVTYEGYEVYKEIAGDLQLYIPRKDWENKIDDLFKIAKKRYDENLKKEKVERITQAKENKSSWIEHIRKTWGM